MIQFKNKGKTSNSSLFRITFNTAFIAANNQMKCTRWQISPEDLQKDFNKFDNNFLVELEFEDFCHGSIDKPPCMSHVTELD